MSLLCKGLLYFHKWQATRTPWAIMLGSSVLLLALAHYFFQNYLYMPPCEQCVYIRYAFLLLAIGAALAMINPGLLILRLLAYVFGFYGSFAGLGYSIKLAKIHAAVHSNDPFGVQGCSTEPSYPFGLPLERWAPEWFLPTGDCGYDSPLVPDGAVLDGVQSYFINLYENGWYLLPSKHFLSMADCTMLGFGFVIFVLGIMAFAWIFKGLLCLKA